MLRSIKGLSVPVAVFSVDDLAETEAMRLGAAAFVRKTRPEQLAAFIDAHCRCAG